MVYVAENELGEIIGFSDGGKERSGKYKDFDGELYAIYLLQKYQGQGIGTKLVKSVVNQLKNIGTIAIPRTHHKKNRIIDCKPLS